MDTPFSLGASVGSQSHTCQGVLKLDLIAVQDSVFAYSDLFLCAHCPDVLLNNVISVTVLALCASVFKNTAKTVYFSSYY